jgi:hypothetical protein
MEMTVGRASGNQEIGSRDATRLPLARKPTSRWHHTHFDMARNPSFISAMKNDLE